jgi:hypothetical protein
VARQHKSHKSRKTRNCKAEQNMQDEKMGFHCLTESVVKKIQATFSRHYHKSTSYYIFIPYWLVASHLE